jgi:Tfp pilus assembly protein PilF
MAFSTRTSRLVIALVALVIGVIAGGVAIRLLWPPTSTAVATPASGLAPTADQVAYRFAITGAPDPRVELDKAIAEAEKRASTQPLELASLAGLYYQRGQLGGDKRDYDVAAATATRSLEALPSPNGATLTLANVANARHEFREAIRLAENFKGKGTGAPIILATAYLAVGELPAAARAAHLAVDIRPGTGTYLMRALVLQAQGRDDEAATDFIAAARVEDHGDLQGAARLRALWGRFLVRRGELAGAALVLDEALRIAPDFPLAQAYRGELLLRSGKPKEAAAQLDRAFAASRQVRYLMDEARALELAGEKTNADALRAQVESIVRGELGEGGLGHRLDLVEVLIDRGGKARITEATTFAREEVTRRPSADTLFQLARAEAWAGDYIPAQADIQAALATGAREPQIYELAARIERQRGNPQRAAVYARFAAELDPTNSGWRMLGMP